MTKILDHSEIKPVQWDPKRPSQKKTPRINSKTWQFHKAEIHALYVGQNQTLEQVRRALECKGFKPSRRQLVAQLQKWNIRKNQSRRVLHEHNTSITSTQIGIECTSKNNTQHISDTSEILNDAPRDSILLANKPFQDASTGTIREDWRMTGFVETLADRYGWYDEVSFLNGEVTSYPGETLTLSSPFALDSAAVQAIPQYGIQNAVADPATSLWPTDILAINDFADLTISNDAALWTDDGLMVGLGFDFSQIEEHTLDFSESTQPNTSCRVLFCDGSCMITKI